MMTEYPSRGRARIGVVVPVTNTNLEPDMTLLAPNGVSLHFARAGGYDIDRIPDEHQMRQYSDTSSDDVIESLKHCRSDVIVYGCTSATLSQGPEYDQKFRSNMERIANVPAVTAASALTEVLATIHVGRFAFTSPYVATLNDLAIRYLQCFGMECVHRVDAATALSNEAVGSTHPDEIVSIALGADHESAEAIVISCTDYRATEAISVIERETGKPVVTSNQASMLVALKRLDIVPDNPILQEQLAARSYFQSAF